MPGVEVVPGIRTSGHTPATTHTNGTRGWVGNTRSGRAVRVTTAHIPAKGNGRIAN